LLKLEVNAHGEETIDLIRALEEIASRLDDDFTSGMDSNNSGGYTFNVEGEEGPDAA
jgi:hypothetical protein